MTGPEVGIVVIEDDHNISDLVAMYLRRDGFRVVQAEDAERGLAAIERESPRLVIVDLGLPGELDGLDVCRRLAADTPPVPVLILSARDDEVDRILGLELGADDYVTKPFSARELVARVHAILRRVGSEPGDDGVLRFADIEMDENAHEVTRAGHPITLTATEFNLLRFFLLNPRHVLSKSQILDHVWHYDFGGEANVVETYVSYLRKKLDPFGPPLIHTVRLVGYALREPAGQ